MTKKQLIEAIAHLPDDAQHIWVNIHGNIIIGGIEPLQEFPSDTLIYNEKMLGKGLSGFGKAT